MPIDSSIALGVRQQKFESPLEGYGKALSIRSMLQEGQLHQEQLKHAQLANQEAARDQQDQEKVRQAYVTAAGHPEKTVQLAIESGAGPKAVQGLQKHFADSAKTIAETKAAELPARKYRNEQMQGLLGQASQMSPEQIAQAWPTIAPKAAQLDPENAQHWNPQTPPGPDELKMLLLGYGTESYYLSAAEEKRKTAAEGRAVTAANQTTAEHNAKLPGVTALSEFNALRAKGQEPEQLLAQKQFDETKNQHQQTNTNEQARIGLERQRNTRDQAIYEQTYGAGSNEALRGVAPNLRGQASTAARKLGEDYLKASGVADDMESLITMTRNGNKAAGSNLPLVGVETINALNGIKRINRTEIEQYAGAGSLLDNLKGKIGKLTVGKPIPEDVLKDIEAMHNTLRGNGDKRYQEQLKGLNDTYKSNFQPVKSAAKGKITVTAPDGSVHPFDTQAQADQFKKLAGIK